MKFGSVGGLFGGLRSNLGVFHASSHVEQLPDKQPGLRDRNAEEEHRKKSEPVRIVSDPLRLESELPVNLRFFVLLGLLLFGLLLGGLAGNYFYRERYLVGAALIGCGWLCGLIVWFGKLS